MALQAGMTRIEPTALVVAPAPAPPPHAMVLPPAPTWSLLALERSERRPQRRVPRLGGAVHSPLVAAFAGLLGALAAGSWVVATVASACTFAVVVGVLRLPVTRRWVAAQELAARNRAAFALRSELASALTEPLRNELSRLEALVEAVRVRERRQGSPGAPESTLLRRLDGLLVLFVDLAIEVRQASFGVAMTADAAPCLSPAVEACDGGEDAARQRFRRIARLRIRARDRCRSRIEQLQEELAGIGQLVRLVHEQSLTSRVLDAELEQTVADVLDEAEHTWQAHAEVAAALPDHGTRS